MQPQVDSDKGKTGGLRSSAVATCAPAADDSCSAVDVDAVKATISEALAERPVLPRYEELCALHQDLLKHIEAVVPLARQHIDRLWHGSQEWYSKSSQLSYIPYEVAMGLGSGLQSAAWHVKSLGYSLRFLLENSELTRVGEGERP